jgi:hypothetical protein
MVRVVVAGSHGRDMSPAIGAVRIRLTGSAAWIVSVMDRQRDGSSA